MLRYVKAITAYTSNKLFLAASKHVPKGWCYDHIGFVDGKTGDFVQMSGHRYAEGVFSMTRLSEDETLATDDYDVINLPKTVTFSDDSLGAQNCVTFVVAVLEANGMHDWDQEYFHRIFKCSSPKKASKGKKLMSDFKVIELSPYARKTHRYESSEDVADCQGAEIYVEELMYEFPRFDELDEIHTLIRDQGGVDDGTCVELARQAENAVQDMVQRVDDRAGYFIAQGPSCPIRSRMYGGIPSGGGFGSNTEWELGAQRAAEAAHCILGSLGRNVYGKFEWDKTLQMEEAHIREELGIIQKVMKEYSQPVYTKLVNDPQSYEREYVKKTIDSVRSAGPALAKLAKKTQLQWTNQKNVPLAFHDLGYWSYQFLIDLGRAMFFAAEDWPEGPIGNPYNETMLKTSARRLTKAVDDAYKNFVPPMKREMVPSKEPESPYRAPPPTKEEQEALERQPDEEQVDYIMRLLGSADDMMIVTWENFSSTPWTLVEQWTDVVECGEYHNVWPCGRQGEVSATKVVKCTEGHSVLFQVELEFEFLNRDLIHRPKPKGRLEYYEPDLEFKAKYTGKSSSPVCLLPEDEPIWDMEDCYPWDELLEDKQDFEEFILEDLKNQLIAEIL